MQLPLENALPSAPAYRFRPTLTLTRRAALRQDDAISMPLRCVAKTEDCQRAIQALVSKIYEPVGRRRRPSPQYIDAVAAAVADLLKAAEISRSQSCYRAMSSASFSGQPIGYDPFKRAVGDLQRHGFLMVEAGERPFRDEPGIVTRVKPSTFLLEWLGHHGISPANRLIHFSVRSPSASTASYTNRPVLRLTEGLKRSKTYNKIYGKRLPVDLTDPRVAAIADQVRSINKFMATQTFSLDAPPSFFRAFNQGDDPYHNWSKGGRLCCHGSGYQQMSKEKRAAILINGNPTVELDVSSCHLTIAYALTDTPLPNRADLYDVGNIPRTVIKLYVNSALSGGKLPVRWTKGHQEAFAKKHQGKLADLHSMKDVAALIARHFPVVAKSIGKGLSWADYQHVESQIITNVVHSLAVNEGIASLSVHDSLIIEVDRLEDAVKRLHASFINAIGIRPTLIFNQSVGRLT